MTWLKYHRKQKQDTKRDFTPAVNDFARRQASLFVLSKSAFINILTIGTLLVWVVVLITSILPINLSTTAIERDLAEVLPDIGEKAFGHAAVPTRTYFWCITFALLVQYSIFKKGTGNSRGQSRWKARALALVICCSLSRRSSRASGLCREVSPSIESVGFL